MVFGCGCDYGIPRRHKLFKSIEQVTLQVSQIATRRARMLGFSVSALVVIVILARVDLQQALSSFGQAHYPSLVAAILCLIVELALRAWRWGRLFKTDRPRLWLLFSAMMVGYVGNNLLPARAGELARAHVIGQLAGVERSRALGTIAVERVVDGLALLAILSLLLPFVPAPRWIQQAVLVAVLLVIVLALVLAVGFLFRWKCVKWGRGLLDNLPCRLSPRVESVLSRFMEGVGGLSGRSHVAGYLAITIGVWLVDTLATTLFLAAFGLSLPWIAPLFLMAAISLSMAIPSSPAYVGTFEIAAIGSLEMFGVSESVGLGVAMGLHAAVILATSLIGMACLSHNGLRWRSLRPVAQS